MASTVHHRQHAEVDHQADPPEAHLCKLPVEGEEEVVMEDVAVMDLVEEIAVETVLDTVAEEITVEVETAGEEDGKDEAVGDAVRVRNDGSAVQEEDRPEEDTTADMIEDMIVVDVRMIIVAIIEVVEGEVAGVGASECRTTFGDFRF